MDNLRLCLIFACLVGAWCFPEPEEKTEEHEDMEDEEHEHHDDEPEEEHKVKYGYPNSTAKATTPKYKYIEYESTEERYKVHDTESEEPTDYEEPMDSADTEETSESVEDPYRYYCPPCLVWKSRGYPCQNECHSKSKNCGTKPGCYCPGNLRLNNDGECVSPHLCPRKKHKTCCNGKRYTTCGNSCAQTCGAEVCTLECKEGCFCMRGTKDIGGVCQPPNKCLTCAAGKVPQKCGRRCDEICGCVSYDYSPFFCEEGCFCPRGKRIVNGVCRPEIECPRDDYYPFYKKK